VKLSPVQDQAIAARMALVVGATTFDRLFAGVEFHEADGDLLYVFARDEEAAAEMEDRFSLHISIIATDILKHEIAIVLILPNSWHGKRPMCNLYSITTNQAAIIALFRVVNRYVGNLPPMPGVFPDYPAPAIRNTDTGRELTTMRWGMPPPPKFGGPQTSDQFAAVSANQTTSFFLVSGFGSGAYSAKLFTGTRQRFSGFSQPRQCGDDV
jgi:hypothetical protein